MKIRISKESAVPIPEQLAEEIMFSIVTGELKPRESLPSVRALARQLKIHRNTVSRAYQELVNRSLVVRKPGRCLIVRPPGEPEQPTPGKDLDDLINDTIVAAQDHGYSLQQLRRRVEERLMAHPPDHVLVVAGDSGLRHLVRHELLQDLVCPVNACDPEELTGNPDLAIGALVLGSAGVLPRIALALPKGNPAVTLTFSPAEEQLQMIGQLSEPSMIALVSISELLLQTARGLLAPAVGSRHTLREYFLPAERPRNLSGADLVICDSIAFRRVKARRVECYRVVSQSCLDQITKALQF